MIETIDHSMKVCQALLDNPGLFVVETKVALTAPSTLRVHSMLSNGQEIEQTYDWEHGPSPVLLQHIGHMFDAGVRAVQKEMKAKLPHYFRPKPVLRPVR